MGKYAVTGAFGFSGRYITAKLLESGHEVLTLTRSTERNNPFGKKVTPFPYDFENPDKITEILGGVDVLFNTYWVRFNYRDFCFKDAVNKNRILFNSAKKAGVKKVVYVSVTNAAPESDLEYFRGKAECELALKNTGIPYSIIRPAVIFGNEDILINNIAWMIRNLPVIGIFGDGNYRLQPIFVEDLADYAISLAHSPESATVDAIGPETFTFKELIDTIQKIIGTKKPAISINPLIGYYALKALGKVLGDVILTKEEIKGLLDDLLYVKSAPVGKSKLTDWLIENRNSVGRFYAHEIKRRTDREKSYDQLKS